MKASNLVLLQFTGKFSLLLPLKVRRKLHKTWGSYGNSTYMYSCLIWTWLNSSNVHVFAEHHFIKQPVMWCGIWHPVWQIYKRWWPKCLLYWAWLYLSSPLNHPCNQQLQFLPAICHYYLFPPTSTFIGNKHLLLHVFQKGASEVITGFDCNKTRFEYFDC